MKAPISACLIVRNEEGSGLFEECLQSIRPFVEELVIVDTGSTDGTPEIAQRHADRFEVFTGCNDPESGAINDFSLARNRSFDLATRPWVMWIDSDDVLAGGEHLAKLVQVGNANRGDRDCATSSRTNTSTTKAVVASVCTTANDSSRDGPRCGG